MTLLVLLVLFCLCIGLNIKTPLAGHASGPLLAGYFKEIASDAVTSSNTRNGNINSSPFLSNQRSLPAVKINQNGLVYDTQILKQQLANELKLPLRDLRVVDPSFPSQIQATFTARPTAILFCIENVKVVLKYDEAIIFGPSLPEVREFIPALQQQLMNSRSSETLATDAEFLGVGMISSSSSSPSNALSSSTRFEHVVLETALNVVCNNLFRQVRLLSPSVAAALNDLRAQSKGLDVIQTQVDELLPLKNKLDLLSKRVMVIKKAITDILESDEDMIMMHLEQIPSSMNSEAGSESPLQGFANNNEEISGFSTGNGNPFINGEKGSMDGLKGGESLIESEEDKKSRSVLIKELIKGLERRERQLWEEDNKGGDDLMDFQQIVDLLTVKSPQQQQQQQLQKPSVQSILHRGRQLQPSLRSTHHQKHHSTHHKQQQQQIQQKQLELSREVDTMNLEMLFENYLNEVEWIASEIDGLQDNITNTEENVVLQLDLLRNRILRFELFLSISSFVVTGGALIAGLFGMNLVNHMETNANMFYTVCSLTVLAMFWSFMSFKRYGRRENLF